MKLLVVSLAFYAMLWTDPHVPFGPQITPRGEAG